MYKCHFCSGVVGPRVQLKRHTVYRKNGQIAAEYPICADCVFLEKFTVVRASQTRVIPVSPYYNASVLRESRLSGQEFEVLSVSKSTVLEESRRNYDSKGYHRTQAAAPNRTTPPKNGTTPQKRVETQIVCNVCGKRLTEAVKVRDKFYCAYHGRIAKTPQ